MKRLAVALALFDLDAGDIPIAIVVDLDIRDTLDFSDLITVAVQQRCCEREIQGRPRCQNGNTISSDEFDDLIGFPFGVENFQGTEDKANAERKRRSSLAALSS